MDNPFTLSADQSLLDEFITGSAALLSPEQATEFSAHLARLSAADRLYVAALFTGQDRESACRIAGYLPDDMGYAPRTSMEIERKLSVSLVIKILQEASAKSLVLSRAERMQALTLLIERGVHEGGMEGARVAIRAAEALNRMQGDEILTTHVSKAPLSKDEMADFLSKVRDV